MNKPARYETGLRGFSLIELVIATVIGSLVIMATFNVLIGNQRTLTAVAAKIRTQQTLRSGVNIIAGELREISPSTGDLVDMGDDSVQVRVTRSFGLVCSVNLGLGDPRLTVKTVGEPFVQNDSIFVLAANDPVLSSDDVWKLATVRSVISTTTCNGADTAQVLTIGGTTVGEPPDSISVGAPMRGFLHYTYGLFLIDGQAFLAREEVGSATPVPMVGPLRRIVGEPTFTYWDASGTAAITPSQVATIRLALRTGAQIPGGVIQDSLIVETHPRN